MITFACSSCGRTLRVSGDKAGKRARCPRCSELTDIPAGSGDETLARSAVQPATGPAEAPTLAPDPAVPAGAQVSNTATFTPGTAPMAPVPARSGVVSIPGYEILGELGRGGMGVIYKARQLQPRRLVALKMILAGEHASADQLGRFRAEAEAIARLQHPNIVHIHEVKEHNGRPFLTLEFIEGGSLAQYLKENRIKPKQAAELVQQLARGVHYAHKRGIVHRDLKPANVLLGHADDHSPLPWVPKLTDFGLAKQLEGTTSITPAGPVTQSGAILGTPQYMAPEQIRGKTGSISPATDVYALGAILYELLTGKPPFHGGETVDTLLRVANEEPKPLRQLNPKLPRDLETICLKCLRKEPERRYASAQELADDLRRHVDGEPIRARPHSAVERVGRWLQRRRELVYLFGGVAAMLLLTVLVLAFWNPFGAAPSGGGDGPAPHATLPPDLDLIPRDLMGFASLRVADLWALQDPDELGGKLRLKDSREWKESMAQLRKLEAELGLAPQDLERVTFVLPNLYAIVGIDEPGPAGPEFLGPVVIFKFTKTYDFDRIKLFLAKHEIYQDRSHGKWTIYEPESKWGGMAFYPHSDRILLVGRGPDLAGFLDRSANAAKSGPLQEALELAAQNHHLVVGVNPPRKDMEFVHKQTKNFFSRDLLEIRSASLAVDALPPAKSGELFAGVNAELRLKFQDAASAIKGMAAAKDLLADVWEFYDRSRIAKDMPPLVAKVLAPLRQPDWQQEEGLVRLNVKVEWQTQDVESLLAELDAKLVTRTQSQNNLKQIGLGMHGYHDSYKHFPPAALTAKTDMGSGAPLLSWRVAVLPYMELDSLYNQFRRDEPWDSPHNIKLLDKMPDVFKAPRPKDWKAKPEDRTHTFYQVFVGPGTAFDPKQKVTLNMMSNKDGSSNTILVVEAAKAVPWTKPDDIPFDQQALLPRLGGIFPDGFNALFGDGSARFVPNTISEQTTLRRLITFNDGMAVQLP